MDAKFALSPLAAIGQSLARSFERHVLDDSGVRNAFNDLAFEVALARQMQQTRPESALLGLTS